MHTGLPGRKQIYSYVQDNYGVWWKTLDYTVTEVCLCCYPHHCLGADYIQVPEETVLTDPTGLHLSAGPYMLIYSRHMSDEEQTTPVVWPQHFTVCSRCHSQNKVHGVSMCRTA
jgi:hypothetical protein